jgi:hypothetical protein
VVKKDFETKCKVGRHMLQIYHQQLYYNKNMCMIDIVNKLDLDLT